MPPPQLGLKHFILQARARNLYRYALRAARHIPEPGARKETIRWIRSDFDRNRFLTDINAIEEKIASGRRELRQYFPAMR
ncbi:hypothetical protein PENSPDRAFT_571327 [Peniophora sp. CONT]|nr:hypothetical protein PENSPDRAFT_571327 [Peniophora sp. CONT]